jgi:hypothetical protein
MPQICSFLIRASAWLAHGVNDPAMSLGMEDYESHVRMFGAGVRGVALPRAFFNYRIRKGSMSRTFNPHIQAFLQRRVIANNRDVYGKYGAQLAGMFAENGHGALAPSPTREAPAHAALFGLDIPSLQEVDHELERSASRDRLGRALRARAYHGGPAWDYTVGRLLLSLDLAPEFARRSLVRAANQMPDNGWYSLYAIIAHLRAGDDDAAKATWSTAFASFYERELGAVRWVAGLEQVRGFPRASRGLCAGLGTATVSLDGPYGLDADPAFTNIDWALARLEKDLAAAADVLCAAKAYYASAESVISLEAATAVLNRRLLNALARGTLDGQALRHLASAADQGLGAKMLAGLSGKAEWLDVMDERWATLEPRRLVMAGSQADPHRPQRSLLQRVLTGR